MNGLQLVEPGVTPSAMATSAMVLVSHRDVSLMFRHGKKTGSETTPKQKSGAFDLK
jgi:hypothetical protein